MSQISISSSVAWFAAGFRIRGKLLLLIIALNTVLAAWIGLEDARPFIHPFIMVQTTGLTIAYWVNCFQPWNARRPMLVLGLAVAIGSLLGMAVNIGVKLGLGLYTIEHYRSLAGDVALSTLCTGLNALFISAVFVNQFREVNSREALHQAESARLRLARQAVENELKLMQAQVEPHFLFNTLSNVQFLVETNPPVAAVMLGHLTDYLRAAIPQLRQHTATLGDEAKLAESYLAILKMRMGKRLRYEVEIPAALKSCDIPPMMLLSLVENAIKHGVEPAAQGGEILVTAVRDGTHLRIVVADTGRGLVGTPGSGVGLSSIRERLNALYGDDGRLLLEDNQPSGLVATLMIPEHAHA